MRNLFYTLLLLLCTSMSFAVPIVVSNQSPTLPPMLGAYITEYDVEAHLGILKDGGTCEDTFMLSYFITAGTSFVLLDGTSLYNGVCISQYIGLPTCDPFPLDHNGQRMGVTVLSPPLYTPLPWYLSPNGFYATTENSIDCHPNGEADIITPTSYEKLLIDTTVNPPVELLKISYIRFGNALATIDYE